MILTRSPYYYNIVHVNQFVQSVDFEIEIGTGNLNIFAALQTYELTKLKPSGSTFNTYIDLSPFIADVYKYSPIDTSLYAVPTSIKNNGEVLITRVTATQVDNLGNTIDPTSNKFICSNGYGYHQEGQNHEPSEKILLSHTEYKAYEKGYFIVPLRCNNSDADPTVNGVAVDLAYDENVQDYIKYLVIPLGDYSDNITVVFGGDTIYIELIEECKYPVTEVQFINRFGAFESIHFYKATKETLTTKADDFKNSYTNGVSYDIQRHQKKQFNKTSSRKVKIETGYLNPYYNQTLQELMESEYVWIDGKPVNVTSNSLEFKTRIIDKLISYSIDFEYAYDEINSV